MLPATLRATKSVVCSNIAGCSALAGCLSQAAPAAMPLHQPQSPAFAATCTRRVIRALVAVYAAHLHRPAHCSPRDGLEVLVGDFSKRAAAPRACVRRPPLYRKEADSHSNGRQDHGHPQLPGEGVKEGLPAGVARKAAGYIRVQGVKQQTQRQWQARRTPPAVLQAPATGQPAAAQQVHSSVEAASTRTQ